LFPPKYLQLISLGKKLPKKEEELMYYNYKLSTDMPKYVAINSYLGSTFFLNLTKIIPPTRKFVK